jgi:hypothetical protein
LIFSGDLSQQGQVDQLKHGALFLEAIAAQLKSQHDKPTFVVKVPGNHDCYIPDETARTKLTDAVREGNFQVTKELIMTAQRTFWELCPLPKSQSFNNKLVFLDAFSIAEKTIAIVGFNSSWMSNKHEQQGQIEFDPTWFSYVENWVYQNNPDLVITVTHHPLYWQGEQVHRELWSALEKLTDFLFTGHEHRDGSFIRKTQDSTIAVIEGGLLNKNDSNQSTFNVVNIDLQSPRILRHSCTWDLQNQLYTVKWFLDVCNG